jgi:hypothetical protein
MQLQIQGRLTKNDEREPPNVIDKEPGSFMFEEGSQTMTHFGSYFPDLVVPFPFGVSHMQSWVSIAGGSYIARRSQSALFFCCLKEPRMESLLDRIHKHFITMWPCQVLPGFRMKESSYLLCNYLCFKES